MQRFKLKALATGLIALPLVATVAMGTTLSGSFDAWNKIGDANWRIENGEFVADMGAGHLVSKESYTDFHLTAEFWTDAGANSGVFLRVSDPNAITDRTAYEANIFDTRPDPAYRTGAIVNFASPSENLDTAGKWNTYDITVQGDHIVLVLNGVQTVDVHDSTYASGPISLQYGQGVVKFRNVEIEKL
jgi:hypothetical protein